MLKDTLNNLILDCERKKTYLKTFLKWFTENYEWDLTTIGEIEQKIGFETYQIKKWKNKLKLIEKWKES